MRLADRRGWRQQDSFILLFLILITIYITRGAWMDMVLRAIRDQENGHALFAPAVALYLFWLRRSRLQFIRYRPSLIGTAVVASGLLLSWWGIERDVLVIWHAGALLAVVGCLLTMTGLETIRQFLPVLICLLFVIPTPGAIRIALAAPLQEFSTAIAISILDSTGVQAAREGQVLLVGPNSTPVAIGEACNGMRMVFALVLVVYGFVFSWPFRASTRVLLLGLSPIIALSCNVIRLVPTSLVYGHFSEQFANEFHWAAGFVMLPLALLMLMLIIKLLNWLDIPTMSWRLAA